MASEPIEDGRLPGLREASELLERYDSKHVIIGTGPGGFSIACDVIKKEIDRLESLTPKPKAKKRAKETK